jgi:predicted Zn-dependent protease
VVPWLRSVTAFTAPGRYIYFSRRLLEVCPDDESAAFVVAHELAHHDLGHLRLFSGPFTRHAARMDAATLLVLVFRSLQKRVYSPEWEVEADRRAVELCVAAGYDGHRCLRLFDVLERVFLDRGDISGVYGLDVNSDAELSPEADLLTKARIWLWQRQRGYLPIQDRRAEARRHLDRSLAAALRQRQRGHPDGA